MTDNPFTNTVPTLPGENEPLDILKQLVQAIEEVTLRNVPDVQVFIKTGEYFHKWQQQNVYLQFLHPDNGEVRKEDLLFRAYTMNYYPVSIDYNGQYCYDRESWIDELSRVVKSIDFADKIRRYEQESEQKQKQRMKDLGTQGSSQVCRGYYCPIIARSDHQVPVQGKGFQGPQAPQGVHPVGTEQPHRHQGLQGFHPGGTEQQLFDFGDGNGPVPAHIHPNGGGWVADTAKVPDTAYVGPEAQVYGRAILTDDAHVAGKSKAFTDERGRLIRSFYKDATQVTDSEVVASGGTDSNKSPLGTYVDKLYQILTKQLAEPLSKDEEESFVIWMNDCVDLMTRGEQTKMSRIFSKLVNRGEVIVTPWK